MNCGLDWSAFVARYRRGESYEPIFFDMVLADLRRLETPRDLTLLDIGCGKGFGHDPGFQTALAAECRTYLGVEPDGAIEPNPVIQCIHRCRFEGAPIESSTVDVAYAVMVLEHLECPGGFWDKLHAVLREGGIFWGFTVDARHWFARASILMGKMRLKEWYLNRLHGKDGAERHKGYPAYYRSNTPEQIERFARKFRSTTILNFDRIGQLDYYFPGPLKWFGRRVDAYRQNRGLPGCVMAVRVVK